MSFKSKTDRQAIPIRPWPVCMRIFEDGVDWSRSSHLGTRIFRNYCHRRVAWAIIALWLAILQGSVDYTVGQDSITIFQYTNTYGYEHDKFSPFQVPNSNAKIDSLNDTDIACLGEFIADYGLLVLAAPNVSGSCLYRNPVQLFKPPCVLKSVTSFSTMFRVFLGYEFQNSSNGLTAFVDQVPGNLRGLAFIITSDNSTQGEYYLNSTSNGQYPNSSHNFAVGLDFFPESPAESPGELFVSGLKVLVSVNNRTFNSKITSETFNLSDFGAFVWIEYDGSSQVLTVKVEQGNNEDPSSRKPTTPLLSTKIDLTDIFQDIMFVGFAGSLSNYSATQNPDGLPDGGPGYVIADWTFNSDGPAPDYPRNPDGSPKAVKNVFDVALARQRARDRLIAGITVPGGVCFLFLTYVIYVLHKRNSRFKALAKKYEIMEELEQFGRGAQSFKYKALSDATQGFNSSQLLGSGGFGSVYKGNLFVRGARIQSSVAVKRISATSHQGAREFLAEVKIIGQVQHRNLVRLVGWCHERGELLLVYDYMPNGSLDQHLFKENGDLVLTWARRLKIVSGIATALVYLHEDWEQRVIHRDVKSSNVMLDTDFNARLGDFGLARLSDHAQAPHSTMLAGTHGYLAPELGHTFKATEKTDVYSFGALVLEVATGKRPLLPLTSRRIPEEVLLVDWVWGLYRVGTVLEAADGRLQGAYDNGEMMTLLKIGLLCSHPDPEERPTMREVLNIWKGASLFPPLPRTKPVPVFISGSSSIGHEMELDQESILMVPLEDYDPQYSTTSAFTVEDVDLSEQSRDRISAPRLHSKQYHSTPLPV